jgi:hypothetical protein
MRVPEIRRQLANTGIQEIGVLEHLVVCVVLRREAERMRLDAHVDVLRHQDHVPLGLALLERTDDGEDLVVGLADSERRRQLAVDGFGL